jgi:type IV pilus modification protein PilV
MKREIKNEKGFTLIEVLVAVFLLAVGMMSAASMQTAAISGNKFSKDTSLAIELAEEMMDRIRINAGREPHKYDGIDTSGTCPNSDPFKGDCEQWQTRMLALRNAVGTVTVTPDNPDATWSNGSPIPYTATIDVKISWQAGGWMGRPRSVELTTIKGTGIWGQN